MLELVYAMILTSIGSAIIFNCNASSGGTDIAALILKKYTNIDVGKALLCVDFIVASSSFFIFNVATGLFSLLGLFAKSVFIVSEKHDEISAEIMKDMKRGVTGIYSRGCYYRKDNIMLMCIVRSKEIPHLLEKVKRIDKYAFTVISEVREVRGEGFNEI